LCNTVTVDRGEVVVEELGYNSQGVEVAEWQAFQDQEPDLCRKYDTTPPSESVEILVTSY